MSYSGYSSGSSYHSDNATPRAIKAPNRASLSLDNQALGRSFIYSSYKPAGFGSLAAGTPPVHSTNSVHEDTANLAEVGVDVNQESTDSTAGSDDVDEVPEQDATNYPGESRDGSIDSRLMANAMDYGAVTEGNTSSGPTVGIPPYEDLSRNSEMPGASDVEAQGAPQKNFFTPAESAGKISRTIHLLSAKWHEIPPWKITAGRIVGYLPAVFLGALMNILDALSYGMIMFPVSEAPFNDMGPVGLSMFYVSTIIAQLVYSLGGSAFKSGIGSEMIEVTPFFHQMATSIMTKLGEENQDAVLATTMVTFAFSTIITGITFGCLGKFKLGKLVGFFPRHILVGCVGGVGYFLIVTAIEVCSGIEGGIHYDLETLRYLFEPLVFLQWLIPLIITLILIFMERVVRSPLLVPGYIIFVFVTFHLLIMIVPSWTLDLARQYGWVFPAQSSDSPWWSFYHLYKWNKVSWWLVFSELPTILALTFFGVLHVPINVPALALSTGEGTEAIDVDRELRAHGVSNILSGLAGSIQNYLVYTNSVLFIRAGADSRLSGVLLAVATTGIMFAGPSIIGFIPVCVVGTLVYLLGYELVKEALWDTIGRVRPFEYATIAIIVVVMGAVNFVVGILVGILLACMSFVYEASTREVVSGIYSGEYARSIVVRHPKQLEFLEKVGRQICVFKLTGSLFFGSIGGLEDKVRDRLAQQAWQREPIKFLIIDMNRVPGIDFSAAEGFKRLRNMVIDKGCFMLISSVDDNSVIVRALEDCGLWETEEHRQKVQLFNNLNSALEWCENRFLADVVQLAKTHPLSVTSRRTSYVGRKQSAAQLRRLPMALLENSGFSPSDNLNVLSASPRHVQLVNAAQKSLTSERHQLLAASAPHSQPLPLILKIMQGLADNSSEVFWSKLCPYLEEVKFNPGELIYNKGKDKPAVFFVEHGLIEYEIVFNNLKLSLKSSVLPLTLFGDMARIDSDRKLIYTASDQTTVWKLDSKNIAKICKDKQALYQQLLVVYLRLSSQRYEATTSNIVVSS